MPAVAGGTAWVPFASDAATSTAQGENDGSGLPQAGSVGALGAKNLNLRRRSPLSPFNKSRHNQLQGTNAQQGASGKSLQQHSDTAIGGKVGMLKRYGAGGWVKHMPAPDQPADADIESGTAVPDLAVTRSRVKSEVDEALSEIQESISELAMLLKKDEDNNSQLVESVPAQLERSPAPSTSSLERQSLHPVLKGHEMNRGSAVSPNLRLRQARSLKDVVSFSNQEGMDAEGDVDIEKVHCDLSYDLSMSYSMLGKTRHGAQGAGISVDQSELGPDNVDLTNLSMNLSQDDECEPSTAAPQAERDVDGVMTTLCTKSPSNSKYQQKSAVCFVGADNCDKKNRNLMGDCSQALQLSAANISVTVSEMSCSMHDTCEYSKYSPSPRRNTNQIMPKDSSMILSPAPHPPVKAGIGIKFKQPHRGSGYPVEAVVPGGPADCAGIVPGDVLMFVARNTMTTESSSKSVAESIAQAGNAMHLVLRRGNNLTAALVRRSQGADSTIGTAIAKANSRNPQVCSVSSGSPAEKAGVLAGDEVVAVGSVCAARLQREELLQLLTGEHGSLVVLGLLRSDQESGIQWVALRRSGMHSAMHIQEPRANEIVAKSPQISMHALQENRYVSHESKDHTDKVSSQNGHRRTIVPIFDHDSLPQQVHKRDDGCQQLAVARNPLPNLCEKTEDTSPRCETCENGQADMLSSPLSNNPSPHKQPSVLRHSPLSQQPLPQAIVMIGGATVSVSPGLYQSQLAWRSIPSTESSLPSSQNIRPAASRNSKPVDNAMYGLVLSPADTASKSRTLSPGKGAVLSTILQPAEKMLYSSNNDLVTELQADARFDAKADPNPKYTSASSITLPESKGMMTANRIEPREPKSRSESGLPQPSQEMGSPPKQWQTHARGAWYQNERNGQDWSAGGKYSSTSVARKSPADLEGDALVAAALEHISQYESRRRLNCTAGAGAMPVNSHRLQTTDIKWEHSRRLDTDIKTEHSRRLDTDISCIMRATGVSASRAKKALEDAYLDPVDAILNIKKSLP